MSIRKKTKRWLAIGDWMGHKENVINRIMSFACVIFMAFMLMTIVLRVFTRQILVERMGMHNAFTSMVFWDAASLEGDKVQTTQNSASWSDLYPFTDLKADADVALMRLMDSDTENTADFNAVKFDFGFFMYLTVVDAIKAKFEDYSTDFLMGHDIAAEGAVFLDKSILWEKPINPEDYSRIIEMENGYLTYVQPRVEDDAIFTIADNVEDFYRFLDARGIKFVYMNTGSKVSPADMQLSDYEMQFEHTNENGDRLVDELRKRDIYTIDFRHCMLDYGLDWYKSYYVTDHHWTNETQLWAAGIVADAVNELTGSNIDRTMFDTDKYAIEEYENYMFGGEGRVLTLSGASLESYKLILPDFETNLRLTVYENDQVFEGPYTYSLFDMDSFDAISGYSGTDFLSKKDPYNCTRIDNYPLSTIENLLKTNNDDLKILFIEDSFNWYLASYLALDVGRMDIIYPIAFDGSIRSYVDYYNPDIVILSSCEKAINPIDYGTHTSYFDLR